MRTTATTVPREPLPAGIAPMVLVLGLLFLTSALTHPMLDKLVREPFGGGDLGRANKLVGWFMMAGTVAGLFTWPLGGWWSDRRRRRVPFIAAGALGSGLCVAVIALAPAFNILLAASFFHGIFTALAVFAIMARAADLGTPATRGRVFAMIGLAIPAGYLVAPMLTHQFGEQHHKILFVATGLALALASLPHWFALGNPENEAVAAAPAAPDETPAPGAFTARYWVLPVLFGALDKITFGIIAICTALVMKDAFGGGERMASLAFMGFWLGFFVTCVPAGRASQRFGALRVMVAGSLFYGLAFAALGLAPTAEAFIALMALCGALSAFMHIPCMSITGELSPPGRRGIGMGIFNLMGTLGMMAGIGMAHSLGGAESHAAAYGAAGGLKIMAGLGGIIYLAARRRPSAAQAQARAAKPARAAVFEQ